MYEPVSQWELDTKFNPRPGVVAFRDCVLFWTRPKGCYDAGIYNRRAVRGVTGRVTVKNASLHAVGRAWDCGVPNASTNPAVGQEIAWRCSVAANLCGIVEVIWNRHRWTAEAGSVSYSGKDPHTSHVHIGFSQTVADSPATHDNLMKWYTHALFGL
jgi:hypothetical protein